MKIIIITFLIFSQYVTAESSITKTFNTSFYEKDVYQFSIIDVWTIKEQPDSTFKSAAKGRETGFLIIERYAFGRETGFKHFATIKNDKLVIQNNANKNYWWKSFMTDNSLSSNVGLINYSDNNKLQALVTVESNNNTWTIQAHFQKYQTTNCNSFEESCNRIKPSIEISKFDETCTISKKGCEGWNGLINSINTIKLPIYLLQQYSYPAIADKFSTGKYYVQNIDLENNTNSFEVY